MEPRNVQRQSGGRVSEQMADKMSKKVFYLYITNILRRSHLYSKYTTMAKKY